MVTSQATINLSTQLAPPIIQAVQGDTGREISFSLADFVIPTGASATYYIQKPSGEAVYNAATISGNTILCELTAQSLAEVGENNMQVRIIKGEDIVTSFDVILLVRTFRGVDAVQSDTEMNIFDKAVAQAAEDFQTQAEAIVEEVIESIPEDYTELTEEVSDINERLEDVEERGLDLSEALKQALLQLASKAVYIDADGQEYYDALYDALYPIADLESISAVYTQSGTVYDTDTLDSLKADLVVTATYADASTETVASDDYVLSGTLETGTSTITISYGGKTTTFTVTVTHNPYWVVLSISDEFVEGTTFSSTYNSTYGGYYSANSSRCAYAEFGFIVEQGYKYTFETNASVSGVNFGINWWSAECLPTVANHRNINSYAHADSGWKTSGYTYTPNDSRVALIQWNKTKSYLLSNGITELKIIREVAV